MRLITLRVSWLLVLALCAGITPAQAQKGAPRASELEAQPESPAYRPEGGVPEPFRLIRFSGTLQSPLGEPVTGVLGVTFALYSDQEGGAPLWLETQNVQLDEQGRYAVLLGSTASEGMPLEVFSAEGARWLGVQPQGQPEQPRVLLVAVPFALKAAEAETLGGRSASEFVLAEDLLTPEGREQLGLESDGSLATVQAAPTAKPGDEFVVTGSGTTNFIPKWSATDEITNSVMFEAGGKIGIGTTGPTRTLDVAGSGNFLADLSAANLFSGNVTATGIVSGSSLTGGSGLFTGTVRATDFTALDGSQLFLRLGDSIDVPSIVVTSIVSSTGSFSGSLGGGGTLESNAFSKIASDDGLQILALSAASTTDLPTETGVEGETLVGASVISRGPDAGIIGWDTNTADEPRVGVHGVAEGPQGHGVVGVATSATGATFGVKGRSESEAGVGVAGLAISATGTAGQFTNQASGKILSGVAGTEEVFAVEGDGSVRATAFNDLSGNPIFAQLNSSNTFQGDVTANNVFAVTNITATGEGSFGNVVSEGDVSGANATFSTGTFSGDTPAGTSILTATQAGLGSALRAFAPATAAFPDGAVIYAEATDTVGASVSRAIVGIANSPIGRGVQGSNLAGTGTALGVIGISLSTEGWGVLGQAGAATGPTIGVRGAVFSTDGLSSGVWGGSFAATGDAAGVAGFSNSDAGVGVRGIVNFPNAVPGQFINNAGGNLLAGISAGQQVFAVDGFGNVFSKGVSIASNGPPLIVGSVNGEQVFSVDGAGNVHLNAITFLNGQSPFAGVDEQGTLGLNTSGAPLIVGQVNGEGAFSVDGAGRVNARLLSISGGSETIAASISNATAGGIGLQVVADVGVFGQGEGVNGRGLHGFAASPTGFTEALRAEVNSPDGVAGRFFGTGSSKLLSGVVSGGPEVFFVDGAGNVRATDFTGVGGNQLFARLDTSNTLQGHLTGEQNITALGTISGNFVDGNDATFANNLSVGGGAFSVDSGGNVVATSVTETSSRRWKQNIRPLSGALGKVEGLRGVVYESTAGGKTQIGVIAEEVGAVMPEVVTFEENGVDARGVDYARLTALLIEAVKEQQELIRRQQERIQQQEARLEMLQATLDTVLAKLNQNSEEVARLQPEQ